MQAEIFNDFWLSFSGRVNKPKSSMTFGLVFRGGSQAEIFNDFWLSFSGRVNFRGQVIMNG